MTLKRNLTTAGDPAADTASHDLDALALEVPDVVELDTPREGVPFVISTDAGLQRCAAALAAGTGPVAVDAERASGFR